jgi:hypothetical protein
MQKNIFLIAIPYRKIGRKKGRKNRKFKKINIKEKVKNKKFLVSKKLLKWGSVFTNHGIHGTLPKKIPKVYEQNTDFHL